MSAHPLPDNREMRRLVEDSSTLARCRVLARIRGDLAGTFTTADQRLAAAEELDDLLRR